METFLNQQRDRGRRSGEAAPRMPGGARRGDVLVALGQGPGRPADLSRATGMRPCHVSRALGELAEAGLVECLNPRSRSDRWYGLTPPGTQVLRTGHRLRRLEVPSVRGSHILPAVDYLKKERDSRSVRGLLAGMDLNEPILPNEWYPVDLAVGFLDAVEEKFGDGSNEFVACMASEAVRNLRSVRSALRGPIFLEEIPRVAAQVYLEEFNHGRLEAEVGDSGILITAHHWLTSPARCAAWVGALRGILRMAGLRGDVEEVSCSLDRGTGCRYLVTLPALGRRLHKNFSLIW